MGDNALFGGLRGCFENDTLLWFIILFLLLFWGCRGIGCDIDCKQQIEKEGLTCQKKEVVDAVQALALTGSGGL